MWVPVSLVQNRLNKVPERNWNISSTKSMESDFRNHLHILYYWTILMNLLTALMIFKKKKKKNTYTYTYTPTCLAYTSEDSYVLIYKVRLEVRWGPRSADPPKMVKHDVFGVFSQRFPRTRFWVLGRCRVLGVSVCFHMKVLGSISKANAHTHTHTHKTTWYDLGAQPKKNQFLEPTWNYPFSFEAWECGSTTSLTITHLNGLEKCDFQQI